MLKGGRSLGCEKKKGLSLFSSGLPASHFTRETNLSFCSYPAPSVVAAWAAGQAVVEVSAAVEVAPSEPLAQPVEVVVEAEVEPSVQPESLVAVAAVVEAVPSVQPGSPVAVAAAAVP